MKCSVKPPTQAAQVVFRIKNHILASKSVGWKFKLDSYLLSSKQSVKFQTFSRSNDEREIFLSPFLTSLFAQFVEEQVLCSFEISLQNSSE